MGIICVLENPVFQEDVARYQKKHNELMNDNDLMNENEVMNGNFDEHLISFISNRYQISEMVLSLRRQRNCGTVQTSKQYEFIYNALKDEIINPVPKEEIKTFLRPPPSSPNHEIINLFPKEEIITFLRPQLSSPTHEIINPVPKEDIKTILRPPLSSPRPLSPPESVRSPRTSQERGRHWTCRSEVGQVGHMSFAEHFNAQHN